MNTYQGEDILKEFDNEVTIPDSVDMGIRFVNLIIDWLLSMVFLLATAFCLGIVLGLTVPNFSYWIIENRGLFKFLSYVFAYTVWPLYFVLQEGLLKGRTIGKLITGTVAIRLDGQPLSWGNVFGRAYARIVPFEMFSGFGTPWHDSWTATTVVKKADLVTM
ncbi:MAG: domain containing protein [Bacteroidetes bacterium]|uniref:RDD family protein n=1 Tax=Chitinophaga sancti TaxID=1004 RepID=UPI001D489E14|nr:RDD family protein [Chitinophaga sancti]MBP1653002.1 domain containing protein [Bacteroidota bacterium]WPQ65100.1 RDD family protein [Chitinophaga sancti]